MKILCKIGLHKLVAIESLFTSDICKCVRCDKKFVDSIFGLFDYEHEEK